MSPGSPGSADNGWDWDRLITPSVAWRAQRAGSGSLDVRNSRVLKQTGEGLVPTKGWSSRPLQGRQQHPAPAAAAGGGGDVGAEGLHGAAPPVCRF